MKKFRDISEQYREEGRHKLIYPKNKAVASPRPESDSAKVKLGEETQTPPIGVRSLYTKMYAKHGGTASKAKDAQSKAYSEVEKKHGKEMRNSLEAFHKKNMNEAVKDKFDIGEYDQEGDMAKSDLRSILANAKRVHDMLKDSDNLPEWVQSKITKAEDYMSTVANYMEAEMNEEVEQLKGISEGLGLRNLRNTLSGIPKTRYAQDQAAQSTGRRPTPQELARRKQAEKDKKKGVSEGISVVDQDFEEVELDEGAKETQKRASELADKLRKKDPEKSKIYRNLAIKASQRSFNPTGVSKGKGPIGQGNKAQRRLGKEPVPSPMSSDRMRGYSEEVELDEENKPTNPELWSRAVAMAKSKFDVYPSAYANGWAAKWYKERGGGWRSVNEENYEVTVMHTTKDGEKGEHTHKIMNADDSRHAKNIALQKHEKMLKSKGLEVRGMGTTTSKVVEQKEDDLPFKADKPQKQSVIPGKYGAGYSMARQLARQAMQKQIQKMKKPMKEAEERGTEPFIKTSRKAEIVKNAAKKNKDSDKFESQPILGDTVTRNL